MSDDYTIKIPMAHLMRMLADPMQMFQHGGISLTYNQALGVLTDYFIAQYQLFPLRYNKTDKYAYKCDGEYLHITVPKEAIETRELQEGDKGYNKQ